MLDRTQTEQNHLSSSEVVKQLFDQAKMRDDAYFSSFTENALYQVGSYPPIYGEQAIREFLAPILEIAEGVDHVIDVIWEMGDKVICQGAVMYVRRDGKSVPPIPVCNIILIEGDKIRELRAYGDFSPLFHP